jgi:uncharacterized protein YjbI with pentapeptide repeats
MFWLIVIAILFAVGALAAWWWLPKWWVKRLRAELPDAKDRADIEDNFRKTVGQLIAAGAVIGGAVFAYWQTQQTLNATLDAQRRQTQQTNTSQLFSKAVDVLDGKGDPVKLQSGIAALEGVMASQCPPPCRAEDAGQFYFAAIDILSGYVRARTEKSTEERTPADVEAVLRILNTVSIPVGMILADAHIPYAGLRNVTWRGANLNGIHLNNATLTSSDLMGAQLVDADLSNATTFNLNLAGANLTKTHFRNAVLVRAILSSANLTDADLTNADLTDADLTNADLTRTTLIGAKLTRAKVGNARNLTPDQLSDACGDDATLPSNMAKLKLKTC